MKNYHKACLVALRFIPDEIVAEDIVQESFVMMWERRNKLKQDKKPEFYLFTTVKNKALNYLSREKKTIISAFDDIIDEHEESNPFKKEETILQLSKAIAALPEKCRLAFELVYFEGYTYQQAADYLNVSKNTIKTQMGIAYSNLKKSMNKAIVKFFLLFSKKD